MKHRILLPAHRQRGLTLVELMVAIVLMLLITVGTVALYSANSAGKRTIDASQQLDDTARFIFELIGQAVHDAGFPGAVVLDTMMPPPTGINPPPATYVNPFDFCSGIASQRPCPVLGFDNSKLENPSLDSSFGAKDSGGVNASDTLAVRFNGSGTSGADGSVLTCSGTKVANWDRPVSVPGASEGATDPNTLGLSLFYVNIYKDEPELYCTSDTGIPDASTGLKSRSTTQIARGVESFQVMYGVDICSGAPCDGIPDRWVSARDMATADWRNVKAVRVGLVLRGAPGSAQASDGKDLYPLGKDFTIGMSESGIKFTPPADTRLRRVYTTTFLLRNPA